MRPTKTRTAKLLGLVVALMAQAAPCAGQWWDSGGEVPKWFEQSSDKKLKLSFEQRTRYEGRWALGFGKEGDEGYGLLRTRLGMSYTPVKWLKVSALAQDSRAPGYVKASNSFRDALDLQEAYFEIGGSGKRGFGVSGGRQMLN